MQKRLQMMDLFEYIIKTWTRCNYDKKKKYHIDFCFTKEEHPIVYTIEMWSSTRFVRLSCVNVETKQNSQIQFSYATCIDSMNRFGIEKFLEIHMEMISNLIKNKE